MDGVTFMTLPRYSTKNMKPRTLPLTREIVSFLPFLRAAASGDKLLPFKPAWVWRRWDVVRSRAKQKGRDIDDVVLHTMRHTFLTGLARSGKVPIERISDWAGHSSVQVTMDHYLHLMPEDKLETLAVVEELASTKGIRFGVPSNCTNTNDALTTANCDRDGTRGQG